MTDPTAPTEPPRAPAATPSRAPRALAITGVAVSGALLLGLTFGAGALVGRVLPGSGPIGLVGAMERGGPFGGDRTGPRELGERLGALTEEQRERLRGLGDRLGSLTQEERERLWEQLDAWLDEEAGA